jgi:hypothetical protein
MNQKPMNFLQSFYIRDFNEILITSLCSTFILQTQSDVIEVCMSCLAFMTLKNACQAAQLVAAGGIPTVIDFMNQNSEDVLILVSSFPMHFT